MPCTTNKIFFTTIINDLYNEGHLSGMFCFAEGV